MSLRLGVLDQSPVPVGSTASEALANSLDLARHAGRLGYVRYWVAEHHGMDGLAGSSPEIMVGAVADATERIRVGAGGVMLTHYAPLKVAESFRVLHGLHPGRIDLGIGRAPGSDMATALALAPTGRPVAIERYPDQVDELLRYLDGADGQIKATPRSPGGPDVWVLASSVDSASIAAHFGLPLGWAHFITMADGEPIVRAYLDQYRPSARNPEPTASVAAAVICADTDAEAQLVASSVRRWRAEGLRGPIPEPDPDLDRRAFAASRHPGRKPLIVGDPDHCATELGRLATGHGVDELIAVTITHDHQARIRSYELLAEVFGLGSSAPAGEPAMSDLGQPGETGPQAPR
jgi:luciferase family oxidoreductase group 1